MVQFGYNSRRMLMTKIYKKYKITQPLQLHQFRVAAVAKQVCDSLTVKVDEEVVITACLLHDIGNILKFEFSYPAEFFEPEGIDYWKKVKKEFEEKYGSDEHKATLEIAKELGASQKIINCIDSIGFREINSNYFSGTLEQKICNYADMRVGPHGIIQIGERLKDGQKRYQHRKSYFIDLEERKVIKTRLEEIETEIFNQSKIKPPNINDSSVQLIIEQLKTYQI